MIALIISRMILMPMIMIKREKKGSCILWIIVIINIIITIIIHIFQVIIVDNYHKVASEATGDNYHLNLDGILYLGQQHIFPHIHLSSYRHILISSYPHILMMMIVGGVKASMYRDLPPPLLAEFGFQVQ